MSTDIDTFEILVQRPRGRKPIFAWACTEPPIDPARARYRFEGGHLVLTDPHTTVRLMHVDASIRKALAAGAIFAIADFHTDRVTEIPWARAGAP